MMNTSPRLDCPTRAARFLILDFETVTPRGRPPEPIEVAAILIGPGLERDSANVFQEFVQPPPGAPVTVFDTRQTGIRPEDVQSAAFASAVLGRLNAFACGRCDVVVAQNARYEAAVVRRFRSYCDEVSMLPFLDTVLLAKHLYRDLPNYGLDALADHLSIPLPASRHRALPDVELTAKIFVRMIGAWEGNERTSQLADLIEVASIDVDRRPKPEQHSLFD